MRVAEKRYDGTDKFNQFELFIAEVSTKVKQSLFLLGGPFSPKAGIHRRLLFKYKINQLYMKNLYTA